MANPTVRVGFLGDASQLAREARRAQDSLDGVSRHAHTTSTALGTALGTVAGRGIGALAGAARNAVGSVGALASTSIQAASDMHESLSKNQAVFGTSAKTVQAWASDTSKNILLTKQAAIEGAATFGNLFVALGVAQKPAAALSTQMVGLAEDLSSFNDVGTDRALEALRSGLLGEAEPLRQFGVSLSEARVQAEAYALGLVKPVKDAAAIQSANVAVAAAVEKVTQVEKAHGKGTLASAQARDGLARAEARLTKAIGGQKAPLTDAVKLQARQSIIMKDTAVAQGDAARTSGDYANSTRTLHRDIGNLSVSIGEKLLPYALDATKQVSKLVREFDNGTGAGGEIRDALAGIGETARGIGDDLKPVLGVARWFSQHPDVFKGAVEGMVAYRIATKSAALWSERLAAANVAAKLTGVAAVAPGAAAGIGGVAGALAGLTLVDIAGWGAAAYGVFERLSGIVQGLKGDVGDLTRQTPFGLGSKPKATDKDLQKYIGGLTPEKREQFYNWYPEQRPENAPMRPDTTTREDRAAEAAFLNKKPGRNAVAAEVTAQAQKAAADKAAAAQKYVADQAAAAAKRKSDAAEALQKATDKLKDALASRVDEANNIRASIVSSNTVVRDGVSWTAKDLLSRFTVTMAKVKRFQSAISALVHKGYDRSIIEQVAAAGVQGGMGTAVGLAHASSKQVGQFNATQRALEQAASRTGDRVASKQGPINIAIYLDGKKLGKEFVRAINEENARLGFNGHQLAM